MPNREPRFRAMFDALGASVPRRFTVLDLGAGPGSLSARLLRRFPGARSVAVDNDPVTLRIGQGALGDLGGRLTWVDAKLGSRGWTDRLPVRKVHAAVSTSALHWLPERNLRALYRDLGHLIRRNGVFLDGDYFPWGPSAPGLDRLARRVWRRRDALLGWRRNEWARWWRSTAKIPALAAEFAEQKRRHAVHPRHSDLPLSVHRNALEQAGFHDVDVIWSDFGDRILIARR
ncbi:MAG TPA: class I SAM-dependent methyltransferase [Thermoplasmata archaeon]|nr:class I SAM-dependent methyltransferase [Thermoplasmata archaeon]